MSRRIIQHTFYRKASSLSFPLRRTIYSSAVPQSWWNWKWLTRSEEDVKPITSNSKKYIPTARDLAIGDPAAMAALDASAPLVWIDCEMTGLDLDNDVIIELFCIITNGDLRVLDQEGWSAVIHQSKERMDLMDAWCTQTHGETGLTAAVISSTTTAEQASTDLLAYIKKYVPEPGVALLAGNSVHFDKAFLRKGPFKQVHDYLSYRIFDVSSIKEAANRWCSVDVLMGVPTKKVLHKAKDDILESISEAEYYRKVIFRREGK